MSYYNPYEQIYVSVLLLQQKESNISFDKKTKINMAFKLENLYLNSIGTYYEDLLIWKLFFSKLGKNLPVKKSLLLPFACKPSASQIKNVS
jgi:hypothetical protein